MDTARHGVWLSKDLECLQITANPMDPVSLHILLKAKGQNRCTYRIISVTTLSGDCCLFVSLEQIGSGDSSYSMDSAVWMKKCSCITRRGTAVDCERFRNTLQGLFKPSVLHSDSPQCWVKFNNCLIHVGSPRLSLFSLESVETWKVLIHFSHP